MRSRGSDSPLSVDSPTWFEQELSPIEYAEALHDWGADVTQMFAMVARSLSLHSTYRTAADEAAKLATIAASRTDQSKSIEVLHALSIVGGFICSYGELSPRELGDEHPLHPKRLMCDVVAAGSEWLNLPANVEVNQTTLAAQLSELALLTFEC